MSDTTINTEQVDIDKIIAEKLEAEKAKLRDEYENKLKEKDNEVQKQIDEAILEMSKSKTDKLDDEKPSDKSDLETLAERIQAKRERERLAREKEEENNKAKRLELELQKYKLKEQLAQIKKEEPYLADIIDEGFAEGTITSVEQINMIFNDKLKNKLKASYQFEKAIKDAGGDPLSYLEDKNIITDEIAKKKKYEDLVAQKRAKYKR